MPVSMTMAVAILMSMIVTVSVAMPSKNNPAADLFHGKISAGAGLLKDGPHPLPREAVVHDRVGRGQRGVRGPMRQEVKNDEDAAGPQSLDNAAGRELRVGEVMESEADAGDVEVVEPTVGVR